MEFDLYSNHILNSSEETLGFDAENQSENITINIKDLNLIDKWAYLEFETDEKHKYITERLDIVDNKIVYFLPNGLLKYGYVKFQVVFRYNNNWSWKSNEKSVFVRHSINASTGYPEEYPDFIGNAQEVLNKTEEALEQIEGFEQGILERVDTVEQKVENFEQEMLDFEQAEAQRVVNEGVRQTNEQTRQTNELQRVQNENERKQNEIARQQAESQRQITFETNEQTRQATFNSNEQARQQVFEQKESQREENELQRQANETLRSQNETQRIQNENSRVSAENARIIAENNRVSQEETRQTQESSRVNAETLRVSAENTRASNESTRQNNESTRQDNESTRVSNEAAREQNETTRIANEETRVQAETDRATEFATWEDEIDSKANKDYVDKKDTNLQYEIADLKAKLYDTVVGVKQLKTEYASEIDVPTHITVDSVAYPVLDNTAIEVATIKGHTLKWNQLTSFTSRTITRNGITYTESVDGTIVVNGTASGDSFLNLGSVITNISEHKTLLIGCPSGGSTSTFYLRNGYIYTAQDTGNGVILTAVNNNVAQIVIKDGTTISNITFKPRFIDLTQMFGSGNEPTTLEDNKTKWAIDFATKHPEYDAGSLKNVNVEKIISANTSEIGNLPLKKINVIDLGTLNYQYTSGGQGRFVSNAISDIKKPSANNIPANLLCSRFTNGSASEVYQGQVGIACSIDGELWVYAPEYNGNITAFKADMSGVMIYYGVAEELQEINTQVYERFGLGTLTLPNIDLRGVNDIQDTLEFVEQENGTYNLEHTKYIDRVDLGILNWIQATYGNVNGYYSRYLDAKPSGLCLATNYSYEANDTTFNTNNINNEITINALSNIKVKSSNTPTGYLDYELATPVKTVISTGLLFDEVSLLINKYGRIEIVNRSTDNVNADTTFNVAVKEFKDNE